MKTLVFVLEEPSAKAMLEGVLPRLLPADWTAQYMVFEGKQDLHKRLVHRLQHWQKPDSHFIVMRDQDGADCKKVREELQALCQQANRPDALVRIACHELESFYLGDLAAVEQALGLSGLSGKQNSRKYRQPDALANASEELQKLTARRYQKLSGSRAIGPKLDLSGGNRSYSFNKLLTGLQRMLAAA